MSNKVIISIDVEDWYHGPTVISPHSSESTIEGFLQTNSGAERAAKYIEVCLQMLAERNIRATFFWVAEYALRYKHLLRIVADQGHEIACHGLAHYSNLDRKTKKPVFSHQEFSSRTLKAKKILEDIVGEEVIGYRAPNAYISGDMLDALENLGFKYDSSVAVNSLYNKTDSMLAGVGTAPYFPVKGGLMQGCNSRNFIEFPWPYYDIGIAKLPSAGGPFLRVFGSSLTLAGINQSLKYGHAVFYFHPIDICKENIPLPFNISRPMIWLFKGDMVKRRIEKVLNYYQFNSSCFKDVLKEVIN